MREARDKTKWKKSKGWKVREEGECEGRGEKGEKGVRGEREGKCAEGTERRVMVAAPLSFPLAVAKHRRLSQI